MELGEGLRAVFLAAQGKSSAFLQMTRVQSVGSLWVRRASQGDKGMAESLKCH